VYAVWNWAQAGDVLLAKGPVDVYYRRIVAPTDGRGVPFSQGETRWDRQKIRDDYLAPLGKITEGEAVYLFHRQTTIEFCGESDMRQRWEDALSAQETAIRDFVRKAQENGLGSVTGMQMQIVPQVYDLRKATAGSAPNLAPRVFVLD
jgi:hypothetical protein